MSSLEVVDDLCEIRVTAADVDWLAAFTKRVIQERLCACGQISSPIRSIYRWQGEVQDEPEVRVALHTRRSLVPIVLAMLGELHPYEIPGVLVLPIIDGDPKYLRWVLEETADPEQLQR